jgi:hypothetical protein
MLKLLITVFFLVILFVKQIPQVNGKQMVQSERRPMKLRRFGIFELRKIREYLKIYEVKQMLADKTEAERLACELETTLLREEERRRIYEKHLLSFQGGSSVLNDFHSNLFKKKSPFFN